MHHTELPLTYDPCGHGKDRNVTPARPGTLRCDQNLHPPSDLILPVHPFAPPSALPSGCDIGRPGTLRPGGTGHWRGRGADVARAWRGRGAGMSCCPWDLGKRAEPPRNYRRKSVKPW
eukprot:gene19260-biopygen5484